MRIYTTLYLKFIAYIKRVCGKNQRCVDSKIMEKRNTRKKRRERERKGRCRQDRRQICKTIDETINYVDENASTRLRFDELSGSRKRDIPGKLARVTQFGKPRDESNRAFLERAELIIANRGKD